MRNKTLRAAASAVAVTAALLTSLVAAPPASADSPGPIDYPPSEPLTCQELVQQLRWEVDGLTYENGRLEDQVDTWKTRYEREATDHGYTERDLEQVSKALQDEVDKNIDLYAVIDELRSEGAGSVFNALQAQQAAEADLRRAEGRLARTASRLSAAQQRIKFLRAELRRR